MFGLGLDNGLLEVGRGFVVTLGTGFAVVDLSFLVVGPDICGFTVDLYTLVVGFNEDVDFLVVFPTLAQFFGLGILVLEWSLCNSYSLHFGFWMASHFMMPFGQQHS